MSQLDRRAAEASRSPAADRASQPTSAGSQDAIPVVVMSRAEVADDVIQVLLASTAGGALPAWQPGAHIDLLLPSGRVRQYSLTGRHTDGAAYEIAVLVEPSGRGGSSEVATHCQEGATLAVRGPRNHFQLEPADRYLFVVGGIGITPIRPMIATAERAGADWRLLYGGRTRHSMSFVDELTAEYGDRVLVRPQDQYGLLDLPAFLGDADEHTLIYSCGPEPLLTAIAEQARGWRQGSLHVERFAPAAVASNDPDTAFELELVQTGVTVLVPVGRSVLSVAEEAGAFITASCEEGTCGSCETRVLEGHVDHRDSVLSASQRAAQQTMMVCVSRCHGPRLVLDA